jgi:acyl-CoA dehydrogenase
MDFQLPADTLMLRDMLRRFVEKDARPLEMKYFNTGSLEPEERARLRSAIEQMGLWGATVPEKFGGGGLDTVTACVIEEELGSTFVPIELGEIPPLLFECTGAQVTRYLEPALTGKRRPVLAAREPKALRPGEWKTRATPEGEGYILEGEKSLALMPGPDSFFVVLATAPAGLTAFLVERDQSGLNVTHNGKVLLALRGCQVSQASVLGQPGHALASASEEASRAWIRLGARYVGMVERLRAMAAEHARDWVSLGGPLAVRPAVQRMLAELSVEVESARWLVYHAAWLADRGEPVRTPAAQVRMATGEMVQRSIDRVTMIFGGPGPSPEILPQRMVRAVVPSEALELALEYARGAVAAEVLAVPRER